MDEVLFDSPCNELVVLDIFFASACGQALAAILKDGSTTTEKKCCQFAEVLRQHLEASQPAVGEICERAGLEDKRKSRKTYASKEAHRLLEVFAAFLRVFFIANFTGPPFTELTGSERVAQAAYEAWREREGHGPVDKFTTEHHPLDNADEISPAALRSALLNVKPSLRVAGYWRWGVPLRSPDATADNSQSPSSVARRLAAQAARRLAIDGDCFHETVHAAAYFEAAHIVWQSLLKVGSPLTQGLHAIGVSQACWHWVDGRLAHLWQQSLSDGPLELGPQLTRRALAAPLGIFERAGVLEERYWLFSPTVSLGDDATNGDARCSSEALIDQSNAPLCDRSLDSEWRSDLPHEQECKLFIARLGEVKTAKLMVELANRLTFSGRVALAFRVLDRAKLLLGFEASYDSCLGRRRCLQEKPSLQLVYKVKENENKSSLTAAIFFCNSVNESPPIESHSLSFERHCEVPLLEELARLESNTIRTTESAHATTRAESGNGAIGADDTDGDIDQEPLLGRETADGVRVVAYKDVDTSSDLFELIDHNGADVADLGPVTSNLTCETLLWLLAFANAEMRGGPSNEPLRLDQVRAVLDRIAWARKSSPEVFPGSTSLAQATLWLKSKIENHRKKAVIRAAEQLRSLLGAYKTASRTSVSARLHTLCFVSWPMRAAAAVEAGRSLMLTGALMSASELFLEYGRLEEAAECYISMGRRKQAAHLLESRCRKTHPTPRLLCCLGDVYQSERYYEESWKLSENRYSRAKRSLGRLCFAQNNLGRAMQHLETALAVSPLNENSWFLLGVIALRLDDPEKAIIAFSRVVALASENGEAWANLAAAHCRLKKFDTARLALLEALKHNRTDWRLWDSFLTVAEARRDIWDCCLAIDQMLSFGKAKHLTANTFIALVDLTAACCHFTSKMNPDENAATVRVIDRVIGLMKKAAETAISDRPAFYAAFASLMRSVQKERDEYAYAWEHAKAVLTREQDVLLTSPEARKKLTEALRYLIDVHSRLRTAHFAVQREQELCSLVDNVKSRFAIAGSNEQTDIAALETALNCARAL